MNGVCVLPKHKPMYGSSLAGVRVPRLVRLHAATAATSRAYRLETELRAPTAWASLLPAFDRERCLSLVGSHAFAKRKDDEQYRYRRTVRMLLSTLLLNQLHPPSRPTEEEKAAERAKEAEAARIAAEGPGEGDLGVLLAGVVDVAVMDAPRQLYAPRRELPWGPAPTTGLTVAGSGERETIAPLILCCP